MFAKVRPVGSPVPKPTPVGVLSLPWDEHYSTAFCGSGTQSLSIAVRASINIKGGQQKPEVIIPAYGCPDLVAAIVAQNARPVLVDFIDDSPVMDIDGLQDAVNERTVAIIAVNFLGLHERLSELSKFCFAHGLILIEDSAQCFPPANSSLGLADFVVLSFGRGKPINLMGGGALLARRNRERTVRDLRAHYPLEKLRIDIFWHLKRFAFNLLLSRYSYRLLERIPFLHVGETRFKPLIEIRFWEPPLSLIEAGIRANQGRGRLHSRLDQKLAFLEDYGWSLLTGEGSTECPRLRYALLAPDGESRDRALAALNSEGIGASALYRRILPELDGVPALELEPPQHYPKASDFAARLLTLPVHEGVKDRDLETIVTVLKHLAGQEVRE